MGLFDFHIHSYFSDGTLAPAEIVKLAFEQNITQMALTDHDNVQGLVEAENEASKLGIKCIRGIEISSKDDDCPVVHILGYNIKDFDALNDVINENAQSLRERNGRIIEFLKENCSIDIKIDEFYKAFRGTVGKGNLAQYLKNMGYTKSFREAEELMRPYKAGSYGVDVKKAIKAIGNAGGKAFLAHPYNLKKDDDTLLTKINEFVGYGLSGIECFHSNHSIEQTNLYIKYAQMLNLKISGGSDFHGDFKPSVRLGYGKGEIPLLKNELISIDE